MPERVVKVRLSAVVAEYKSAMEEAARKTREVGTEAEKLQQKKEAFNALGTAGLAMGGLLAAGFGIAVKRFADFDEAMSAVSAATHESAEGMGQLREAAIQAGASTVFSATEAANAIEELAKAGVSTKDILGGGLKGALDLASAGGLGVADAAGIASTALTQFGLQGKDMGHVADLLAAGAGKAMGDVSDLSQALNQAGLVAASTGLSIDETTAGLAAFASQGLLGSDAGTSFKTMLQRLTPQSAEAQATMEQLGISAYDASGHFIGLSAFAGNLQKSLQNLTPEQRNAALSVMFGSDAVRAATVLYSEGAKGIDDWTKKVDDQGYAADTARRRLDNLKGDIEALGGALDSALIQTGSQANDTLRTMVQALTGLVGMYSDLPAPVQAATSMIGGVTAAVLLSGGAAFKAIPQWLEFQSTVAGSGLSMKSIGLSAGAAGLALGGLFVVVGELAAQQQRARELAEAYSDTIAEGADKIGASARKIAIDELKKGGDTLSFNYQSAYDAAKKFGVSLDTVTDAALGNQSAIKELAPYYAALQGDAGELEKISGRTGMSLLDTRLALEALINPIQHQNEAIRRGTELKEQETEATEGSVDASKTAAESYLDESKKVDQLNSQLSELINKINAANGTNQDAVSANARWQESLAGITAEVQQQRDEFEKANGTLDGFALSLDENTQSGSANAAMLSDVAGAAQKAAQSQYEVDKSTMSGKDAADKYAATLADQKQRFIDSAIAAGFGAGEVQKLADKVFALPPSKSMDLLANTGPAIGTIDDFIARYGTINGTIEYRAVLPDLNGAASGNGRMGTYASGGRITGPGTSTSDSIPIWASNGEYMLTAADVQAAGGPGVLDRWRAAMQSGKTSPLTASASLVDTAVPYYVSSPPQTHVTVTAPDQGLSLEGMSISGRLALDGDGFARLVDAKITAYDTAVARDAGRRRTN